MNKRKKSILRYYDELKKIDSSGIAYSVDMVRFTLKFRKDTIQDMVRYYAESNRLDVDVYPTCSIDWRYRNLITIEVCDSKCVLGVGFNGATVEDNLIGFLEFNPNKTMPEFSKELNFILSNCVSADIKRIDMAFDLNITRRDVSLRSRGNAMHRNYEYHYHGENNFSEYLGVRNKVGRVKVYNKKMESGLDYDLTRVEVTTEPNLIDFSNHMPEVYYSQNLQMNLALYNEFLELSPIQQFAVRQLREMDIQMAFKELAPFQYRLRKKLEKFIMPDNTFKPDLVLVKELFEKLKLWEV